MGMVVFASAAHLLQEAKTPYKALNSMLKDAISSFKAPGSPGMQRNARWDGLDAGSLVGTGTAGWHQRVPTSRCQLAVPTRIWHTCVDENPVLAGWHRLGHERNYNKGWKNRCAEASAAERLQQNGVSPNEFMQVRTAEEF